LVQISLYNRSTNGFGRTAGMPKHLIMQYKGYLRRSLICHYCMYALGEPPHGRPRWLLGRAKHRQHDKVNPSRESGPGNFRQRVFASVVRAI
jgi:hypothetical protein